MGVGHIQTIKFFGQSATCSSRQCKVSMKDDTYERQLERAYLLYNGDISYRYVGNDIRDRQLEHEYLLYVYKDNRVV